jgi:hypothetical protein
MDGKDCRDNANDAWQMANSAKERRTQSLLVYLAEAWTKLAEELESNEAFRIAAKRSRLSSGEPFSGRASVSSGSPRPYDDIEAETPSATTPRRS